MSKAFIRRSHSMVEPNELKLDAVEETDVGDATILKLVAWDEEERRVSQGTKATQKDAAVRSERKERSRQPEGHF